MALFKITVEDREDESICYYFAVHAWTVDEAEAAFESFYEGEFPANAYEIYFDEVEDIPDDLDVEWLY